MDTHNESTNIELHESVRSTDTIGAPTPLPTAPKLRYENHGKFEIKIASLGNNDLIDYHQTTRYRLDIADFDLRTLLNNYDNGVAFGAGLTGFLVQSKASLDSLSEEINQHYILKIPTKPGFALDTEGLVRHIDKLQRQHGPMSQFLILELGQSSKWFNELKNFRDEEGTHRKRGRRNLIIGSRLSGIEIRGRRVAEFCVDSISRVNAVIEKSYEFML